MPVANYFTMSPWNTEMHKIRFCHSRGIQCMVRFVWDLNISNGGGKAEDKVVELLRKNHDNRSALQILSLWALNRGIIIFPDLDHIKAGTPKTAEEYDAWRVKASETLKELAILLNPLFRKKPMWKHAFALREKEMEVREKALLGHRCAVLTPHAYISNVILITPRSVSCSSLLSSPRRRCWTTWTPNSTPSLTTSS